MSRTAVLPLPGSYWKSAVPVSLLFLPGWTTTVTPCGGVLVGEPFTVVPCGAAVGLVFAAAVPLTLAAGLEGAAVADVCDAAVAASAKSITVATPPASRRAA